MDGNQHFIYQLPGSSDSARPSRFEDNDKPSHFALHAERLCAVNLKHYHHFNGSRIERLVCALHTVLFVQDLNFEGIVFI